MEIGYEIEARVDFRKETPWEVRGAVYDAMYHHDGLPEMSGDALTINYYNAEDGYYKGELQWLTETMSGISGLIYARVNVDVDVDGNKYKHRYILCDGQWVERERKVSMSA